MTIFQETDVEKVRAYWDARPCNIRHSDLEVGTKDYFDEVEARRYFVEPHIPGFADFARWEGKKVLEIGCGLGTDAINFARAGAQITAVDLSARSVELAKQWAEIYGLQDRITFYVANAEELSKVVPPGRYDLVYSLGVIHHTPHPEQVIAEVKKNYLGSGSTLKLMLYNRRSWKVLAILVKSAKGAFWKLDEHIAKNSEAQTGCPVTYSYSRGDIPGVLGPGLSISEMRAAHIFPYQVQHYVKYRYVKNWYFRFLPRPTFRWLERRLGWHLCITAESE